MLLQSMAGDRRASGRLSTAEPFRVSDAVALAGLRPLLGLALLACATAPQAADLGSVTLSIAEPEHHVGDGPNTGINPTVDIDNLICQDPVLSCDSFALTVKLPEDLVEYFPGALFTLFLNWESDTGLDDYDMYLHDADGKELDSSISSGGPESITLLAEPGSTDYTVTIAHYAVINATYDTAVTLSLGEPAAEKSDAEIAQWLAEHGGSAARADELLASCQPPGVTVLADAEGDSSLPLPGHDLQELRVYQTVDEAGEPLIGFELQLDDLSSLTPQTSYFVSFRTIYGDVRGVRMEVDTFGAVSMFSYVVSEDTDGEREGHFVADGTAVPAHESSHYTDDGLIVIRVRPQQLQLLLEHDTLSGFNSGVILFIGAAGIGGASTTDSMPNGLSRMGEFEYLSQEECSAEAGESPSRADATDSARAASSDLRGGGLGGGLLILLATAALRRRR